MKRPKTILIKQKESSIVGMKTLGIKHKYIGKLTGKKETYPIDDYKVGEKASITFAEITKNNRSAFFNPKMVKKNFLKFMYKNKGIFISGVRSYFPDYGKLLIRRIEAMAKRKNYKYVCFYTQNPKLIDFANKNGYIKISKEGFEYVFFLKKL